jgi:hypothetical protein
MLTVKIRARQLQSRHAQTDRTESIKSIGRIPGTKFHEKLTKAMQKWTSNIDALGKTGLQLSRIYKSGMRFLKILFVTEGRVVYFCNGGTSSLIL